MPTLPKGKKRSWIKESKKHIRQTNNASFYHSKQWRMTRKIYIKENALCENCKKEGIITGGQCVDHIKPITLGGHLTDFTNLQTLCNRCHAKKSAMEGVEYRKGIKDYKRK